jgi:hypothetical protein
MDGSEERKSQDDENSVDSDIGVKVKFDSKKRNQKDFEKQISNISYLQDARGISKTFSNPGEAKFPMGNYRFDSIARFDNSLGKAVDRNISEYSERFIQSPFTRNKSKMFGLDPMHILREESDPNIRPNVFNEHAPFNLFDSYSRIPSNAPNENLWKFFQPKGPSNPTLIKLDKNPSPKFADAQQLSFQQMQSPHYFKPKGK